MTIWWKFWWGETLQTAVTVTLKLRVIVYILGTAGNRSSCKACAQLASCCLSQLMRCGIVDFSTKDKHWCGIEKRNVICKSKRDTPVSTVEGNQIVWCESLKYQIHVWTSALDSCVNNWIFTASFLGRSHRSNSATSQSFAESKSSSSPVRWAPAKRDSSQRPSPKARVPTLGTRS